MRHVPLIAALLIIGAACGPEGRIEGRQRRLDTFRSCLPPGVLSAFDAIESHDDCGDVARLLTLARTEDPGLDAVLDSVMHAELIDCFSDSDMVYFFWYYFADAIEKGRIPEP